MTSFLTANKAYAAWLKRLKLKVRQVQISAAVKVNRELMLFYWELGGDILERQKKATWGDGFLAQLSKDLCAEFPDMSGFSLRNLKYIRQWVLFWSGASAIGQQLVAQIPWGHNLVILGKTSSHQEAEFYIQKTLQNGWSRALCGLTLGLALSACSPSAPRTASLPPIDWRLVPEATVLGERRQFFLYGRNLDSARISAPPGVETETGEALNDGRVLSLYLKVHPMVDDSSAGEKGAKRGKPGSREIRVSTPDTSLTFAIKVVDEKPSR